MPPPSDHRLTIWTEAAAWALTKNQAPAAQRLLVIAFDAAMRAGYPEVAEAAKDRLLDLNKRHHLATYASSLDAMKSDDFQELVAATQRQISFEEAERMVVSRPADDRRPVNTSVPLGPQLIAWLCKE